jgi:putative membrane protein
MTMMGMGWGFGTPGLLLMVAFWGGLIALAVWLVSRLFPRIRQPSTTSTQEPSAREILDRRFALGEITREQYEAMKRDLGLSSQRL